MKTTKKDFELFKKEFWKWFNYFGLKNWVVTFNHSGIDAIAFCTPDIENRAALIELSKEVHDLDHTEERIRRAAFHEVCELLLADMRQMAYATFSYEIVNKTNHEIVRTLENTVFRDTQIVHQ